ncbi:calcium/sodium antiporter [Mesotoga sp.]|uniref:calcium/sodium antiporter n=1 Tax=Mesotoga sp. TaxID=2053577 RepID=UPI00345EAE77
MFVSLLMLAAGFALLIKGADYLIEGSVAIAKNLGISELLIGLTIVALGTSAPELAVSIQAAIKGSDIALGNVLGSNIANIGLILGATALLTPLGVNKTTMSYEIPFVILITVANGALILGNGNGLSRSDGIVLIAFFLIFMMYVFTMAKRDRNISDIVEVEGKRDIEILEKSPVLAWVATIGGTVAVILGGNFVVDGGSSIARIFGVSDMLIGTTIVAIGTSLPELVTTISAGRKNRSDLAIGNVVGSNIFNLLLVLGISATISPITAQRSLAGEIIFASLLAIVLPLLLFRKKELDRPRGALLLIIYTAFLVSTIVSG